MSKYLAITTAKASWDSIPGGVPSLTADMVAAACAPLQKHIMLYALIKYAGDGSIATKKQLLLLNRQEVLWRARHQRWNIRKDNEYIIPLLADMTVNSALDSNRCKKCGGVGRHTNTKICRSCGGKGTARQPSGRDRARLLGISPGNYRKTWKERDSELVYEWAHMDNEIHYLIKRQLGEDGL